MTKFTKITGSLMLVLAAAAFLSCSKDDDTNNAQTAKVSATHASPGSPAVDIYVDGAKVTTAQLAFPSTTGTTGNPYLTVNAGTRNIKVSPNGTLNVINADLAVAANGVYSIFAYDTLGSGTTLKALVLGDNLAAPAAGKAHIRFLHLSPDAPNVDLELLKTGAAPINLTNIPYVGPSPNATALSAFTPVDAGSYTINVKPAGTSTVVLNPTLTFAEGKIYTIYARGLLANGVGTALGLNASVITHN
ncbi:MAG: DUF4397 domain-containing protein [Ferruginibacter sp.]